MLILIFNLLFYAAFAVIVAVLFVAAIWLTGQVVLRLSPEAKGYRPETGQRTGLVLTRTRHDPTRAGHDPVDYSQVLAREPAPVALQEILGVPAGTVEDLMWYLDQVGQDPVVLDLPELGPALALRPAAPARPVLDWQKDIIH